ncbi:cytochrome P450 [Pluteus cervinus]|uniref:Cytochrome P450 n=1 Tax=Pluteus cervinus TaxID=181527 RepID=A0ACD3BG10_9AGAR|nr:cytochrome P450 [Pluteus cervinus]
MFVVAPFDPLRKLPGPDGTWFENHFSAVLNPNFSPDTHARWTKLYGHTFRFHGFGKHDYRLMSFDFRVVAHVLNSPTFEKPWQTRLSLSRLVGRGLISSEGAEHKLQRRHLAPGFTTRSMKSMTPVFFQKAQELASHWHNNLVSSPSVSSDFPFSLTDTSVIVDVVHWVSRATFDVIGLTGFNYNFRSLQDESDSVYLAYRKMFAIADKGPGLRGLLSLFVPLLNTLLPTADTKATDECLKVIKEVGKTLVANTKAKIIAEKTNGDDSDDRDILSVLVRSNLSVDASKQLSDEELLDQCSTLLLAGTDSVALGISWSLYHLAHSLEAQTRVRNELSSIDLDSIPAEQRWEALESLPFLDAVVREALRLSPPAHSTIRVAVTDDHIPISQPVVLRDGTVISKGEYIDIKKGSFVHIPIEGINFSEELYGKDAREFRPDRWADLSSSARTPQHPGLGDSMTFSLGPHSCVGYKFSIAEIKVFLGTLLPQFVFKPQEGTEILKFNAILTKPYVKGQWQMGAQLPLVVERYHG